MVFVLQKQSAQIRKRLSSSNPAFVPEDIARNDDVGFYVRIYRKQRYRQNFFKRRILRNSLYIVPGY